MDGRIAPDIDEHDVEEVTLVARGIATAVAPETASPTCRPSCWAIAVALTGFDVDYRSLARAADLAGGACCRNLAYRQRIVHHMVLGELVLRPIPVVVAHRVATYAEALGVKDDFVRVARRYAQGAYGLAWMDLQRNGFVDHVRDAGGEEPEARRRATSAPFAPGGASTPSSRRAGPRSPSCPPDTLGRCVWEMYDSRGFALPGTPGGAAAYLSRSTTSCTCSPTTARTSRASSRCSRSSVAPTPTRRASRGWRR